MRIDSAIWRRQGAGISRQYQAGIYWEDAADEPTILAISDIENLICRSYTDALYTRPAKELLQRYAKGDAQ